MTRPSPFWHAFADMGAVADAPFVIDRAQGHTVWDEDGRDYIDASAALWYANLGHGRAAITNAITAQLGRLDSYSTFGDYSNRPALELAERLAAIFPEPDAKIFLGSGGGDMIESAAKIARASFALRGHPERVHLISRNHGYHGTHGFGTALAGIPSNRVNFGPQAPDSSVVPHDDSAALEQEILRIGPERVAAFFCEPVIGSGGVYPPAPGYLEAVHAICRKHGVLFVADSVICGFGRLGTWLGFERWDIVPDLVATAKGITNGAQPLGALFVRGEVAEPFFTGRRGAPVLRQGSTYSGHPVAAAAALACLDLYEEDDFVRKGAELEGPFAEALGGLRDHEMIGDVRAGTGLMAGVDLADELLADDPGIVARWQLAVRQHGVLVRPLGKGLGLSPPLTVGQAEFDRIASAIEAGLTQVVETVAV